jgi:hypothetical protein
MRALVRRPVGLGNYVPEGACFQTEGEKTCSRLKQRLHSALIKDAAVAVEVALLDGPRFEARAGYQPALVAYMGCAGLS